MASIAEKSTTDPRIGAVLDGEFKIEEKLGSGGMGNVYRAVQQLTERSVAVKVLHPHLYDAAMESRFRQEAQIISRLSHPNIVTVYKCGKHEGSTLYIAMEYVQGLGLASLLDSGEAMDLDRALPLMIQVADALAYAHEQKVVHRDIKPENMMLTRAGRSEAIKILDFGIAKMLDGNASLTKTGVLCGSPAYMAPEQWEQVRDLDGRTDIYALGCVFYELLTGRQPFHAESVVGYMRAHIHGPPPATPIEAGARLAALPVVGEIVMKCLARDRAARHPDAYSLVEALKEAQMEHAAARRTSGPPSSRSAVVLTTAQYVREAAETQMVAAPASAPPPAEVDEAAEVAEGSDDQLRAVTQEFTGRESLASFADTALLDPDAKRNHLLLVAAGATLCTALALALALLR